MTKKYDILASGYVSLDRIIKIDSPAKIGHTSLITNKNHAKINFGGCSVNIVSALGKLGAKAMPLIRVGNDYEESGFKRFLEDNGVLLEGLTILENESTSGCYLVEDTQGEHITLFYPGAMDAKYFMPLNDIFFKQTRLAVMTVASKPDNQEFFAKCLKHSVPLVFGMKSDPNAFPEDFLKDILNYSKLIFMNEAEQNFLEVLFGFNSITDLFENEKTEIIITTRGNRGSLFYQKNRNGFIQGEIPVCKCGPVIDTTGSGDAYMSGFLFGYLHDYPIKTCCMMGSTLASFVVEKEGCCTNLPLLENFNSRFQKFISQNKGIH